MQSEEIGMNNNSRMVENKSVRYLVYADIPGFDELAKEMEENENIPARNISKPAQPKSGWEQIRYTKNSISCIFCI